MSAAGEPAIEIIGHGGAGDFYPGNSRPAIEQALTIGVDRIEIDVQRSADGELVLVHDEKLSRHGREAPVEELRTVDIRSLLSDLLTFDEFMEVNAARVPVLFDVKLPGYEEAVIAAIRRYGLAATAAASSTHAITLHRLKRAFPEMRLGLSTGHMATGLSLKPARWAVSRTLRLVTPPALIGVMRLIGATETMIQHRVCTPRLVNAVHASGRRVYVWTVDRPEQMRRFAAMGVDGIISNRPDLVREIVERM